MPMAGQGTRLQQAGYSECKPMIPINGKPMFQHVVENINLDFSEKYLLFKNSIKLQLQ